MERALFKLVKHTSKLCNGVGKGARHEHIVHVFTILGENGFKISCTGYLNLIII